MKSVVFFVWVVLASIASAQPSPLEDFVLSGDTAYGMLGPEPVCGNQASRLAWSDDGKFLLGLRTDLGPASVMQEMVRMAPGSKSPAPQEFSIVMYDVGRRREAVLWHGMAGIFQVDEIHWFRNSDTGVALVHEHLGAGNPANADAARIHVLVLDALDGKCREAFSVDQDAEAGMPWLALELSPTKPFGVLIAQVMIHEGAARPLSFSIMRET